MSLIPCFGGAFIGITSMVILYFIYKYADEFSDGNIK